MISSTSTLFFDEAATEALEAAISPDEGTNFLFVDGVDDDKLLLAADSVMSSSSSKSESFESSCFLRQSIFNLNYLPFKL